MTLRHPVTEIDDEVYTHPGARGLQPRLVALALDALSARALVWAAALGAGACWGVTIAHPDILRLVASVAYCGTVLVPVLIRDARGG